MRIFPAGTGGSALPTLVLNFQPPELRQSTFLSSGASPGMVVGCCPSAGPPGPAGVLLPPRGHFRRLNTTLTPAPPHLGTLKAENGIPIRDRCVS